MRKSPLIDRQTVIGIRTAVIFAPSNISLKSCLVNIVLKCENQIIFILAHASKNPRG